jgi:hypothetical protein
MSHGSWPDVAGAPPLPAPGEPPLPPPQEHALRVPAEVHVATPVVVPQVQFAVVPGWHVMAAAPEPLPALAEQPRPKNAAAASSMTRLLDGLPRRKTPDFDILVPRISRDYRAAPFCTDYYMQH